MLKHIKTQQDWDQKNLAAKGFTLIELLVVIVILGILAAVVVFAVSGITDRGQKSACKTDARTLRTAAEAYLAQDETFVAGGEAQLLAAGFISEQSTLYDITIAGGKVTAVTGVGKCA